MRVLVWNMAGAFGYTRARHDLAWRYVQKHDPEIALLQEAVPPTWARQHWPSIAWTPTYGLKWGTAIVTRAGGLEQRSPSADFPWLTQLAGCVTVARTTDGEPRWLASIHSSASSVKPDRLRLHDSDAVPRCDPEKIWEIELIAFELKRLFASDLFLCGGDINSALLFDTHRKGKVSNRRLFDNLRSAGFVDLRLRHYEAEQQTYFKKRMGPYQLDHVFADEVTEKRVDSWRVLSEAVTADRPLSDHAPIEVVISEPAEEA